MVEFAQQQRGVFLRPIVRTALLSALATQAAVSHDAEFEVDGTTHAVTIIVEPLAERGAEAPVFMVAFVDRRTKLTSEQDLNPGAVEQTIWRANQAELLATKAQLQVYYGLGNRSQAGHSPLPCAVQNQPLAEGCNE